MNPYQDHLFEICNTLCTYNSSSTSKVKNNVINKDTSYTGSRGSLNLQKYCIKRCKELFNELHVNNKINSINNISKSQLKLKIDTLFKTLYNYNKRYFNIDQHILNSLNIKINENINNIEHPHYKDNTFVIHLYSPLTRSILLPSITIHETIPGHHYFTSIIKEDNLEKCNTCIIEGWGLYVEQFCPKEFEGSAKTSKCLRLCRCIIDLGYNHFNWTLDKCKAFLNQYYPIKEYMYIECERIQTYPGLAITYILGEWFFNLCKHQFSKYFKSLKDYHDKILIFINQYCYTIDKDKFKLEDCYHFIFNQMMHKF